MATVSQFLFFDFSNTSEFSNIYGNSNQAGALTLEVQIDSSSTTTTDLTADKITIYGSVDMKDENFTPIKSVYLKNFRTCEQIPAAGIYLVLTEGISYIKIGRDATGPMTPIKAFANACA